jgi:Tol biopolymer transport system component
MRIEDERDRRIGELLDEAAHQVRPIADLAPVLRRGGRRRALRFSALVAGVAIFVGAIGWAGFTIKERGDASAWRTFGSRAATGWTLSYPNAWHAQTLGTLGKCPGEGRFAGAIFTNTSFGFRNPQGRAPGCGDRLVFAGFPSDGVAVAVLPRGGTFGPSVISPNTRFPIRSGQLHATGGIVGGPQQRYLGVVAGGTEKVILFTWTGSAASSSARADVARIIESFRMSAAPQVPAPTGTIAFTVKPSDGAQPVIYRTTDGGAPARSFDGALPAFSPDGTEVAYRSGLGYGPWRLMVANADGSDPREITSFAGSLSGVGAPSWSPDGSHIVVDANNGISIVDVDTGNATPLPTADYGTRACYSMEPSWSPDGSLIVFAALCDGSGDGLWTVHPDGSGLTRIGDSAGRFQEYRFPVWSPDGSRLVFVGQQASPTCLSSPPCSSSTFDLFTSAPDGSSIVRLTRAGTFFEFPSWSPDGSQIVADESDGLAIVGADGAGILRIPTSGLRAFGPSWQP